MNALTASERRIAELVAVGCGDLRFSALFVSDNSALANGLGGPNPTLTTQAHATRTAEKMFSSATSAATRASVERRRFRPSIPR